MSEERIRGHHPAWEPMAAAACFVGSVLSLGTGAVFTTDWLLDGRFHPFLHGMGIVLLVIGLPILILGGHFMDVGEKKRKNHDLVRNQEGS